MSGKAREAALEALERCRRAGSWSAESVDSVIIKYGLDKRDAALTTHICMGTMQNLALCDYCIDRLSKSKIEPKVRDILRTAVYQLLFMDRIPANAAVFEAVKLCRHLGYGRAAGFVNALLRKISTDRAIPDIPGKGSAEYLSVRYSHPKWLADMMIEEHGYDFCEELFKADNEAPETCIQVNTLKTEASTLKKLLEHHGFLLSEHEWLKNCLRVTGSIASMPGYSEGLFYVQDPAARLAVSIAELRPGQCVLDACAAPGGKSFAAAIDMNNTGSIISCDIHDKKLGLIKSGAQRLGIDIIKTQAADARSPRTELFDAVIADVPCSGLGVIRKKPEIRYKDPDDLKQLPAIQTAILDNLAASVAPGGTLIYSTCTVLKAENEAVVKAFLAAHNDFEAVSFELPHGFKAQEGMYTFWPNIDGTDGFFVAKLRRNK